MNVCDRIRPDLKAYVDGQLPALSRLTIRWHLAHCADCRREIEEMERISNELREEEEMLAPALRARILAALPEGLPEAPDRPFARPRRQYPAWAIGGLATAVLALLFFIPVIGSRLGLGNSAEEAAVPQSRMKNLAAGSAPAAAPGGMSKAQDYDSGKSNLAGNEPDYAKESVTAAPMAPTAESKQNLNTFPGGMRAGSAAAPNGPFGSPPGAARSEAADNMQIPQEAPAKKTPQPIADAPVHMKSNNGQPNNTAPAAIAPGRMAFADGHPKYHHEATLTLLVADVAPPLAEIERIGKEAGGSITPIQSKGATPPAKEITLTVPTEKFETVRKQIARLGEVQDEKLEKKDLAEQLGTADKAVKEAKERARKEESRGGSGNTGDSGNMPPKPESEAAKKVSEAEKQLQTLKQSVEKATITVHLKEKPRPGAPPSAPK